MILYLLMFGTFLQATVLTIQAWHTGRELRKSLSSWYDVGPLANVVLKSILTYPFNTM